MSTNEFPAPPVSPITKQHVAANPDRAARLLEIIPDRPELLRALQGRHVVSMAHFDPELVLQLFREAAKQETGHVEASPVMACKVLGANFLAGSPAETRLSFRRAWMGMGGEFLDLSDAVDEILRNHRDPGEISALNNNYCDFVVLSTSERELLDQVIANSCVPVISAGEGETETPTQALADLYVLAKWRPELFVGGTAEPKPLQIGIFGNPSSTASLRSLLIGLSLFPQAVERVVLLERHSPLFAVGQREAVERAGLVVQTVDELAPHDTVRATNAKIVPELDLIYSHQRLQQSVSRMDMMEFKGLLKPNMILMSPHRQLPEFSSIINNTPHNGFFTQIKAGVLLRAAVMKAVVGC